MDPAGIGARAAGLARLGAGALGFLGRRPGAAAAARRLAGRVERRVERFRATLAAAVWSRPASPWRALLGAAGVEPGDLDRMLDERGLEESLAELARAGVRASADELRGRSPIVRGSFELAVAADDFANPLLAGAALAARTSGTSGARRMAPYGFALFAEEADAERLLLESHGLLAPAAERDAEIALWYPAPPGIAGLHNAIVHARIRPVARWWSQSPLPRWSEPGYRLPLEAACGFGLVAGWPRPSYLPLEGADVVARWLAAARPPRRRALKTFASSAVRVAEAARERGLDLSGAFVFAGGEPLGPDRRAALAATGLAVFARYAATELGLVAGECPEGEVGALHVYADRIAILAGGRPAPARGELAFTTLSASAPLVLLNAGLGDLGEIGHAACGCALARAGCTTTVAAIEAPGKFAAEGVKLGAIELARAAAAALAARGGGEDDVQVRWSARAEGPSRLVVAVHPRLAVDPAELERELLARFAALPGGSLASSLWSQAGTLRIVRELPIAGPGGKHAPALETSGP